MDVYTEDVSFGDASFGLSYDNSTTYEEQVAALPVETPTNGAPDLLNRISSNKVYLPPDSMAKGKRKRPDTEEVDMEEDDNVLGTTIGGQRPNALYLQGTPITHLPTNNIFAYARNFGSDPVGLEWIDDSSCVLIFATNAACRTALSAFARTPGEEPDFDGCVAAKPVPLTIWPPEARINKTLGVTEGLEGQLLVRIARMDDKKVRGASKRSAFYQKHGMDAGKDPNAHTIKRVPDTDGVVKRRKTQETDDDEKRKQLDDELDDFLRDGSDNASDRSISPPSSPPSKMRSDYIIGDGRRTKRSLLQRASLMREHHIDPLDKDSTHRGESRRQRQRGDKGHRGADRERGKRTARGDGKKTRSVKTAEELDAELDAFLNERS